MMHFLRQLYFIVLVQETPSKAEDLVTCIYKNYIMSGSLPVLSDEVVANIARHFDEHFERSEPSDVANQLKTVPLDLEIFENAKVEVETYLRMNIFPQFQKAVKDGKIYVSATNGSCNNTIRTTNGYQHQVEASNRTSSSRLASHPEAFAQTLCEKLEDLMRNRDSKPL